MEKILQCIEEFCIKNLQCTDGFLWFCAVLESFAEMKSVEVVIINQGPDSSFEEDLAKDVQEIITVFSARLYGSRSKKNQKLIDDMKSAVQAAKIEE